MQWMDINKMLAELRLERDQLGEAILVLEQLAVGQGRRRGHTAVMDDYGQAVRKTDAT
jgi:hypothetical protein